MIRIGNMDLGHGHLIDTLKYLAKSYYLLIICSLIIQDYLMANMTLVPAYVHLLPIPTSISRTYI